MSASAGCGADGGSNGGGGLDLDAVARSIVVSFRRQITVPKRPEGGHGDLDWHAATASSRRIFAGFNNAGSRLVPHTPRQGALARQKRDLNKTQACPHYDGIGIP